MCADVAEYVSFRVQRTCFSVLQVQGFKGKVMYPLALEILFVVVARINTQILMAQDGHCLGCHYFYQFYQCSASFKSFAVIIRFHLRLLLLYILYLYKIQDLKLQNKTLGNRLTIINLL